MSGVRLAISVALLQFMNFYVVIIVVVVVVVVVVHRDVSLDRWMDRRVA